MNEDILAKDKIGECRYTIKLTGGKLVCEMRGYGLKATETETLKRRRHDHFAFDAAALRDKMVRLEQRMRNLARLTTQLQANNLTGVVAVSSAQPSLKRPARGVNPIEALKSKV